jgi:hypothetical protein
VNFVVQLFLLPSSSSNKKSSSPRLRASAFQNPLLFQQKNSSLACFGGLTLKGKLETTKRTKNHENQRVPDIRTLIHQVHGQTVTIPSCFVPFRDFRGSHSRIQVHGPGGSETAPPW